MSYLLDYSGGRAGPLTSAVMTAGVALSFTGLGAVVGLRLLPWAYFPWLAATLLGYCGLTQLVKRWYIRRFGMWL
jgi:Mg2+-importing ATPase